jgi:hypothetical protein
VQRAGLAAGVGDLVTELRQHGPDVGLLVVVEQLDLVTALGGDGRAAAALRLGLGLAAGDQLERLLAELGLLAGERVAESVASVVGVRSGIG